MFNRFITEKIRACPSNSVDQKVNGKIGHDDENRYRRRRSWRITAALGILSALVGTGLFDVEPVMAQQGSQPVDCYNGYTDIHGRKQWPTCLVYKETLTVQDRQRSVPKQPKRPSSQGNQTLDCAQGDTNPKTGETEWLTCLVYNQSGVENEELDESSKDNLLPGW